MSVPFQYLWKQVDARRAELDKPVSLSESINYLLDFLRRSLSADESDDEDSHKSSQPSSEASEEFDPQASALKVFSKFIVFNLVNLGSECQEYPVLR